ncbi:TIGR02757 family protein [Olivibacter sitiensis]|uniref:TIGR02757 family protein n=1 Tax=Olivibacter sitiensis TaxID=376470 RepID=UPI0004168A0A|nr:TIGR02757 family protein [Olivibacter sitiensis]
MSNTLTNIRDLLELKVAQYNRAEFIPSDPICIPHRFSLPQDVEIMGFFAAILAWGQRKTIINKCGELVARMDGVPYDFIRYHEESDRKQLLGFKHRTFNDTDLLYFVSVLQSHYQQSMTLEDAFLPKFPNAGIPLVEQALNTFRAYFFSFPDYPSRTKKHISSPLQKSTCKRLNMFLRWMVRKDGQGVDFGLWKKIRPSDLICPCDVHVDRVARHLGLIKRKQTDWQTALELTASLRQLDADDPVKYDFALFGLGVEGEL